MKKNTNNSDKTNIVILHSLRDEDIKVESQTNSGKKEKNSQDVSEFIDCEIALNDDYNAR